MQDTDAFYTPEPTRYTFTKAPESIRAAGEEGVLTFPSGLTTPHPENNTVRRALLSGQADSASRSRARRAARWSCWRSGTRIADGHIGLCKILSRLGIASLRISLPYHDARRPPELKRADYIVSSNIVRTLQVNRQAVRDVRLALWWLRDQGYERLGLLGTSLGSCLSFLTTCHEPLVRAQALNHVSPFFGDVVWRGLSTEHVRQGLDGHVDIDQLRELWRPISPWSFLDRLHDKQTLMVYAKYDLTFPVDLSLTLINEIAGAALSRCRSACCRAGTTRPASRRSSISTRGIWGSFWRQDSDKGSKVPGFQTFQRQCSKSGYTAQNMELRRTDLWNVGTLGTVGTLQVAEQPDQGVVDRTRE